MKRVFLDTNILVDILERREPYFLLSANILDLGYNGRIQLFATSLSFINAIYVCRKTIGKDAALDKIRILRKTIGVSPISSKELDDALASGLKDVEDALQYASAKSAKCECIVTRNKKGFPQSEEFPVYTPEEFFRLAF